jgi:pimeloyl-ACP methyl ester carboxylesterase
MPVTRVNGTDLYYEDTGGPHEPIVFLHGFLFDGRQYETQVASLRDRYRCVTLDFRGQGKSAASRRGYQIEQHTADVLAVIRRLDIAPVHLVGLSMGGFVALRIAAREPSLLRSLTLLNTSAAAHARSKFPKQLILAGVARVAGVSLPLLRSGIEAEMYGEAFRKDPTRAAEREVWRQRWARGRCCVVGSVDVLVPGSAPWSDRLGEFGERGGDAKRGRYVECKFVMSATQILHEGMPSDDDRGCSFRAQAAHWS